MLSKCAICGEMKQKIKTNKKYGNSYVCVDENGKSWRGARCRDCLTESTKGTLEEVLTDKECRKCGVKLPIRRRFHCEDCVKPDAHHYEYSNLLYF